MTAEKKYAPTPLMQQYFQMKQSHPEAILLFRVGDFYETFGEDAIKSSKILEITLTRRANGAASYVELAGFPYHALNNYLPRLVRAGERVAICEQLEDPKSVKGIVKRGVTELITPGVSFNDEVLQGKENNFLASLYFGKKSIGVSFLDITTGQFYAAEGDATYAEKLLLSFKPKEVLYQKGCKEQFISMFGSRHYIYPLDPWNFDITNSINRLIKQFEATSLKGYGIENMPSAITAAGAILYYLEYTRHTEIKHITSISRIEEDKYMWLDRYTIRNLELFAPSSTGGMALIDILDNSLSAMGSRMIRRWLSLPLKDSKEINKRYQIVEHLLENDSLTLHLTDKLSQIGDLERLISKVAALRSNPRELLQLQRGLEAIESIKEQINSNCSSQPLRKLAASLTSSSHISQKIAKTICQEPAVAIQKGGVIARGVNNEIDELRELQAKGKGYIVDMQNRESERTGIPSLKVSFNNVFGYYIEVRNTHKDKVPEDWIRKQTLTSAERYITQELKEYENKILGAEEKLLKLETEIYSALLLELSSYVEQTLKNSAIIATIDALLSFATISKRNNYSRPSIVEENKLEIIEGRHPVIEQMMEIGNKYVANNVFLDSENEQIIVVTGPNMAGKSALLRMCAIMVIMAQIGCFVPAQACNYSITDRVFTRVGASDNISQGESTFMVEMSESASILNNITPNSLVILDEIGRGTSTYDGISIAWSMVEYLHNSSKGRAKTLFATHYHELNEMEQLYPRIKNYHISVKEVNNRVIFLRKFERGGTAHSFGIHVAKMAGMPRSVVERSEEILKRLELQRQSMDERAEGDNSKVEYTQFTEFKETIKQENQQLTLFELEDPILYKIRDTLKSLDINTLSPYDAFNMLRDIQMMVKD